MEAKCFSPTSKDDGSLERSKISSNRVKKVPNFVGLYKIIMNNLPQPHSPGRCRTKNFWKWCSGGMSGVGRPSERRWKRSAVFAHIELHQAQSGAPAHPRQGGDHFVLEECVVFQVAP